jgi:hypothetical protein
VVDDLVGVQDVGSVVNHDVSIEGKGVADAGLAVGFKLYGDATGGLGHDLGDGQHFLTWVVGKLTGGGGRGGVENDVWLLGRRG